MYALTAALPVRKDYFRGRCGRTGKFDDCPTMRMNESPTIEVHAVESEEAPGGAGEPGTPTAALAVANALFQLTGKRIRSLLLSDYEFGKA